MVRIPFLPSYFPVLLMPLWWVFWLCFYVFYLPFYLLSWLFSPGRPGGRSSTRSGGGRRRRGWTSAGPTSKASSRSTARIPTRSGKTALRTAWEESTMPTVTDVAWHVLLDAFSCDYRGRCKPTTYLMFLERRAAYLSRLPDVSVSSMDYALLSSWFASLPCSVSTKRKLLVDLRHLFDFADYMFHVRNDSYRRLYIPKDYSVRSPQVRYVLSLEDFRRFLSNERDPRWRLFFLFTYVCALRIGEVRGIQVKSVSIGSSSLMVIQQATNKMGTGRTEIISPKSSSSCRVCYLPSGLLSLFASFVESWRLSPEDFLFHASGRKDYPVGSSDVYREFHRLRDLAGLPKDLKFHVLRKSEASLLNDMGLPGSVIRDYLGHGSFETTKEYYIGDSEEKRKKLSEILDRRFSDLFA